MANYSLRQSGNKSSLLNPHLPKLPCAGLQACLFFSSNYEGAPVSCSLFCPVTYSLCGLMAQQVHLHHTLLKYNQEEGRQAGALRYHRERNSSGLDHGKATWTFFTPCLLGRSCTRDLRAKQEACISLATNAVHRTLSHRWCSETIFSPSPPPNSGN